MTKPQNNQDNQNTLYAWATGKLALYAIGIAAGIFIWKCGILQKVSSKIINKKEGE